MDGWNDLLVATAGTASVLVPGFLMSLVVAIVEV